MEILFVSSGNTKNGISPIVHNQGTSLKDIGHDISFFTIKGKGIKGYLSHIFILRKFLKNRTFDVVHAHYSLCAITASLAGTKPLVVSLMGSDIKTSATLKYCIKIFKTIFWKKVIVKSSDMKSTANFKDVNVVPNGVDFEKFQPMEREKALAVTGWNPKKKHILFPSNPKRKEKNYQLAKAAFEKMNDDTVELHLLIDIPNELVPVYLNASDVILLTSLWEGSPNVIKEAMACNCKIVTVPVGDVEQVIADTLNCFIVKFNIEDVCSKLIKSLALPRKTNGREKIAYLDSNIIAKQLITIYNTLT
jgi:glycosyltransferase involved in cell wall biosynthesis